MSLPDIIQRFPELDSWLRFEDDGTLEVRTGKVEIGQGIKTAIAMIAAEELDIAVDRIRVQTADTELTPNELITAGSMSVEMSGTAVRIASAAAREVLLTLAAAELDVDVGSLQVENGLISSIDSNEQTDYWTLQGGRGFHVHMVDLPELKDPRRYQTVGHRAQRLDLPAKVRGDVAFVHDMVLPRMCHGRLVKPPVPDAVLADCPDRVRIEGVELVRDGSFLGVVAEREEVAVRAAEWLAARCRWDCPPLEPLPAGIPQYLEDNVTQSLPVVNGTALDEPVPAHQRPADAAQTLTATYYRPYQMHGAMGPSAALAEFVNGKLTVYSHSQGVELLKLALADELDLPVDEVHVVHAEGAGCYGHNGADDVALDAALLAMAVAPTPVQVKWSRADEHGFEPYAPAALLELEASLDADGRVLSWRHESCSFSHNGRPRPAPGHTNLQSAWWRADPTPPVPRTPILGREVGIHRNLAPIYDFPSTHLVKRFVAESPLRTSSFRGLGAFANVFAIESFVDELAHAAGADPVEFRLAHLTDERARAVLALLRQRAPAPPTGADAGRGVALARYKNQQAWCAVLVDASVSDAGRVRLLKAVIAADAGLVIDPDGLVNQLEGGFVQAASLALKEQVLWDQDGVTSRDWESYPILTFSEVPEIETHLVERRTERALGVGEASTGPTPGAIANAIFAASGIRVRRIPFTPEQLQAAAGAAD